MSYMWSQLYFIVEQSIKVEDGGSSKIDYAIINLQLINWKDWKGKTEISAFQ